jgi:hypothetical protein
LLRKSLPGKGVMPRSRHSSATGTPPVVWRTPPSAWRTPPMIWASALRLFFVRNLLDSAAKKIPLVIPGDHGGVPL